MFIKSYTKYNKTTKERYTIYRLCESYRIDGFIRHRTIIGFGKLEELPGVEQKKQLALRVEEMLKYGPGRLALGNTDEKVEGLALHFYHEIKAKKRYDVFRGGAEWETVDMKSLKNSDASFEGNTSDSKTLGTVIETLGKRTSYSNRKPVVVMDAGIATEGNIEMLKAQGYDYLCVARTNLKNYQADTESTPVVITDKRKNPIELLKVKCENNDDHYLWVKSHTKALKENSMNGLLAQRFEEGILNINAGTGKKSGTKKLDKVHQRIGRLKQKYPSVHKYYDITVTDNGQGIATGVSCTQMYRTYQ